MSEENNIKIREAIADEIKIYTRLLLNILLSCSMSGLSSSEMYFVRLNGKPKGTTKFNRPTKFVNCE